MAASRRPGFPHRVTLDLTKEQFDALTEAVNEAGGSMADYMRAMIELYKEDASLAEQTEKHLRRMRAVQRSARRARKGGSTTQQELSVA